MANTYSPFGFVQWGTTNGATPNFMQDGTTPWKISAGNSTSIFFGDLVMVSAPTTSGYLTQYASAATSGANATTTSLVGVFYGCRYYSTGQRKTVWNNFWPGTDATGDVEAFVCTDPNAIFMVQVSGGPFNFTSIGANVEIGATTSGNTVTGLSGMFVASAGTLSTFPMKIINVLSANPPGINGRDPTSANNYVLVKFNNQIMNANVGI